MGLYTVSGKEDKEDLGKKGNVCNEQLLCTNDMYPLIEHSQQPPGQQ